MKKKAHAEKTAMKLLTSGILIIQKMEIGLYPKAIFSPGFVINNEPHFRFDKHWERMPLLLC